MDWDPIQRLIDTLAAYHRMHERLAKHARPLEGWWVFHWFGQPWRAYGYDLPLAQQKHLYVSGQIQRLKSLLFIDNLPVFTDEETARLRINERKAALDASLAKVKEIIVEILKHDIALTQARNNELNLFSRIFFSSGQGNLYLLLADFGDTLDFEFEQEIKKLNIKVQSYKSTDPNLLFEDQLQAALNKEDMPSAPARTEPAMVTTIYNRLRDTWREIAAMPQGGTEEAPPAYQEALATTSPEPSAPSKKY